MDENALSRTVVCTRTNRRVGRVRDPSRPARNRLKRPRGAFRRPYRNRGIMGESPFCGYIASRVSPPHISLNPIGKRKIKRTKRLPPFSRCYAPVVLNRFRMTKRLKRLYGSRRFTAVKQNGTHIKLHNILVYTYGAVLHTSRYRSL